MKTEAQPSTKPEVKPDTKQETKPASTNSKPDTQPSSKPDTKSDAKAEKPSIFKGKSKNLKLGNGDRTLADSSVADIRNTTLGVRSTRDNDYGDFC